MLGLRNLLLRHLHAGRDRTDAHQVPADRCGGGKRRRAGDQFPAEHRLVGRFDGHHLDRARNAPLRHDGCGRGGRFGSQPLLETRHEGGVVAARCVFAGTQDIADHVVRAPGRLEGLVGRNGAGDAGKVIALKASVREGGNLFAN